MDDKGYSVTDQLLSNKNLSCSSHLPSHWGELGLGHGHLRLFHRAILWGSGHGHALPERLREGRPQADLGREISCAAHPCVGCWSEIGHLDLRFRLEMLLQRNMEPKMDGFEWKTLLKWMIWGYPCYRNHHNCWANHCLAPSLQSCLYSLQLMSRRGCWKCKRPTSSVRGITSAPKCLRNKGGVSFSWECGIFNSLDQCFQTLAIDISARPLASFSLSRILRVSFYSSRDVSCSFYQISRSSRKDSKA